MGIVCGYPCNNPHSVYAQHILHNRHEYGKVNELMTLLKPLKHVNPLRAILHSIPPPSRQTNSRTIPWRAEPSFSTGHLPPTTHYKREPVEQHPATRTHNPQLQTRPTCKPKVCTSYFLVHALIRHFHTSPLAGYQAHRYEPT
jgi:hypothetical protein